MRSRFSNIVAFGLAFILALGISTPALCGVLFDGGGNPADDGFVYAGTGALDSSAVFTFDSQGGVAGSDPGYLFQLTTPEGGASGSYRLGSATEFNRATGWTVEARLRMNTNLTAAGCCGNGFGMFMTLGDNVRGWLFSINPSTITTYFETLSGSQDGTRAENKYSVDMRAFHTLKWVQPAGGGPGSLKLFVDGVDTLIATGDQTGNNTPGAFTDSSYQQEFQFFDNGGPGGTAGTYDFIAINTAAPGLPLATIGFGADGGPVNATVIKGGTSPNLGFNMQNTAASGSQNLTTTSITPEALTGTTYSSIPNVSNLPPGSNAGNILFTATTSGTTPAGAHVLGVTVEGNATNSPALSSDPNSPTLTVLDHSNGSFSDAGNVDEITINFGNVVQGSGAIPGGFAAIPYDIFNLASAEGGVNFTARLELYPDGITPAGNFTTLFLADGPGDVDVQFQGLGADDSVGQAGVLDTNAPLGPYSATWTLAVEDHNAFAGNIPNATALTINLLANIVPIPEPSSISLLAAGLFGLMLARRRKI